MIDPKKFQYYTMAHRMRGFAEGLDEDRDEHLIYMLMKASEMLEEAWDDYQLTLPPEQRIGS